jgi:SOS-response transcriptional repressor LexA
MAFARSINHLDTDPIDLAQVLVPRPATSFVHRVKDDTMARERMRRGDILILERGQPLRAGHLVLVAVDGGSKLVRVEGPAGRFRFAGMPVDGSDVEHLATVSRVLRLLLP